jgi:hypothetical protein
MDRIATYRTILKELLKRQAELISQSSQTEIETELTFDEERDHYMLLRIGWTPEGRLFVPTLYARLYNGKIWIENDWTEEGLATGLLEKGVPAEDVVLAFQPPEMRVYTEFAVG